MPPEPPPGHAGPFVTPDPRRASRRRRRRRSLWRHAGVHLVVAAIGIAFAASQGAFHRPTIKPRPVPKLTERAHPSDDADVPGGSELLRVLRVDGEDVVLQAVLGREFRWGVATAPVGARLRAATGDQVIVTWSRDARGRPTVSGVLGD